MYFLYYCIHCYAITIAIAQPCQVSRESHAFSVNSRFSAHLSFISRISFVRLLYTIVSSSDGKLFLLVATSEFRAQRCFGGQGSARTSPGQLNYSVSQTSGFWRQERKEVKKEIKKKGKNKKKRRERKKEGKKIKTWASKPKGNDTRCIIKKCWA